MEMDDLLDRKRAMTDVMKVPSVIEKVEREKKRIHGEDAKSLTGLNHFLEELE